MKELHEMTIQELWMLFPIILKDYNPLYKEWYSIEENQIMTIVGEEKVSRLNHIGSSAVKGLLSKPTIDILLEINQGVNINNVSKLMEEEGWILMSSQNEPYMSRVLNKGYTKYGFAQKVYHLHIKYEDNWGELYFRDYLRDNPKVADDYGQLKRDIFNKYEHDRDGYTNAKADFITHYTEVARQTYGSRYDTKK